MSMLKMLVCSAALLVTGMAQAQTAADPTAGYPNKPVRVIVPFSAGGVTDVIGRVWAQKMSQSLGQNFYVENVAGGGSNNGMGLAARQPADGYTIMVAASSFTINPSLYNKIPYEPKDFSAVTMLAETGNLLVVHPSIPANTPQELFDLIKANPGKYSYAMSGVGTPNHLQGEMLKHTYKLDLVTVPFGGGGPAVQSTVGGHTPIAFISLTPAPPLVAAGQLKALAVTGTRRSTALPNVPTMAEAGISGQESSTFTGIVVPAGTPKAIIDKLHAESVKILASPDMQAQLHKLGSESVGSSPAEFDAQIKNEIALWAKVIEEAKIQRQ
jgi:tripartite-type tricarboxylate transporter receptor subunit TctC